MKICCSQEYYDKVVQYAKSINDKTLENCLERLKQWEKNENHPCEIELYYDHAPYSFGFCERYPDGNTGIVGGLLYHGNPGEPYTCLNVHTKSRTRNHDPPGSDFHNRFPIPPLPPFRLP